MVGYADADRAALGVLQARRRLARGRQQEREGPRRRGLEQAKLPVRPGIAADLGQVAAHQREMMVAVGVAQAADALERGRVADVTAERVAAVGRIGDQPAVAQDLRGLADQPRLRILRVQFEILGFMPVL